MADERGGKYLREARFFLDGDHALAGSYAGAARILMGQMRDSLSFGGPPIQVRYATMQDGTQIRAVMSNGQYQAQIISPVSVGDEKHPPIVFVFFTKRGVSFDSFWFYDPKTDTAQISTYQQSRYISWYGLVTDRGADEGVVSYGVDGGVSQSTSAAVGGWGPGYFFTNGFFQTTLDWNYSYNGVYNKAQTISGTKRLSIALRAGSPIWVDTADAYATTYKFRAGYVGDTSRSNILGQITVALKEPWFFFDATATLAVALLDNVAGNTSIGVVVAHITATTVTFTTSTVATPFSNTQPHQYNEFSYACGLTDGGVAYIISVRTQVDNDGVTVSPTTVSVTTYVEELKLTDTSGVAQILHTVSSTITSSQYLVSTVPLIYASATDGVQSFIQPLASFIREHIFVFYDEIVTYVTDRTTGFGYYTATHVFNYYALTRAGLSLLTSDTQSHSSNPAIGGIVSEKSETHFEACAYDTTAIIRLGPLGTYVIRVGVSGNTVFNMTERVGTGVDCWRIGLAAGIAI